MADEFDNLDLDLEDLDKNIERRNKVEERINKLTSKLGLTEKEKDELAKLNEKLTSENAVISKERDFFASFTDATAKYPGAAEYKDAIKEKVLSGYTVEDATVSTLAKEGKLVAPAAIAVKPESPAGGTAITQPQVGGEKPISEMTQEERRAALQEAEAKGDISVN